MLSYFLDHGPLVQQICCTGFLHEMPSGHTGKVG